MRIGVIGAGIAGLSASILFSKNGHDVVVFDKKYNQEENNEALFIHPDSIKILEDLGIREDIENISDKIYFIEYSNFIGKTFFKYSYKINENYALSITYHNLWVSLFKKAKVCKNIKFNLGIQIEENKETELEKEFDILIIAKGEKQKEMEYDSFNNPIFHYETTVEEKFGLQNYLKAEINSELEMVYRHPIGNINGTRHVVFKYVTKNTLSLKNDQKEIREKFIAKIFSFIQDRHYINKMNNQIICKNEENYFIKNNSIRNKVFIGKAANNNLLLNEGSNSTLKDAWYLSKILTGKNIKQELQNFSSIRKNLILKKISYIKSKNRIFGIYSKLFKFFYLGIQITFLPLLKEKKMTQRKINDLLLGKMD